MTQLNFFEAFKDRYLDTGDNLDINDLRIVNNQKYMKKDLVVELVGREKAFDTFKNLRNLQQIVLSNCSIKRADYVDSNEREESKQIADNELKMNLKTNKSIKSLDISRNQIDSWIEIVKIVDFFPYLEELIISDNPIVEISLDDLEWQISVLGGVKSLIAGRLKINWSSIEKFNKLFVNLKSLNLFDNNLNEIQLNDSSSFNRLEHLSLSENEINWSSILKLKQLENLLYLQLDFCKIEKIDLKPCPNLFRNLQQLNLSNNRLSAWSDISELVEFTNLTDLTIKDNPLYYGKEYDLVFNFIVGIHPYLKVLNRQIITNNKRKEAEIYFMRKNYRAWADGQLKEWNIEKRFNQLIEIYGRPADLLKDAQVSKFVTVNLKCGRKVFKKKLLKSMDVNTFRMLGRRLFNLDSQIEFELWYLNDDNKDSLQFKLDQDDKCLEFYPLSEDCTIKLFILR